MVKRQINCSASVSTGGAGTQRAAPTLMTYDRRRRINTLYPIFHHRRKGNFVAQVESGVMGEESVEIGLRLHSFHSFK